MNPNELRLGNYVIRRFYEPDRIDNKHQVDINDFYWDQESGDIEYWDNFNPIPLTEEWLLKFGFEKVSAKIWRVRYYRAISVFNQGSKFNIRAGTTAIRKTSYVHDLQNLYFALTGKEL